MKTNANYFTQIRKRAVLIRTVAIAFLSGLLVLSSCTNSPDRNDYIALSQGQYNANSSAWGASIRKQGADILIKGTDSTLGGAISKQKVADLLSRLPANGFLTYRFYTDPTNNKISVMFRAAQTATSEPLIVTNDKFCPVMCD